MKICIALHQCMDLGGIINHTEQLAGGFKDLGHEVKLLEFVYADNAHDQRKDAMFKVGPTGIPYHQGKGWNFPRRNRVPYKTSAGLQTARQILENFDLVVWTVPVPSKNQQNKGNDRWPALYDLKNPIQIAFSHDGNAVQGYPHLMHVTDKLAGLACVHGAALGSTGHLDVPRALVLNPQFRPIRPQTPWDIKRRGFVNMQTFKAWKHAHELIEAIAYMPEKGSTEYREVAGKGIEYQYMTSEDKCKPQYFHDQTDEWFSSMKFWDAALKNGMVHHDYWDDDAVDDILNDARVLVDPSWSKKYSKFGGHWNRVVVDGMIRGCVPVAHKLGMGTEFFVPGVHYIDLSEARDAEDYSEIIQMAWSMDAHLADHYRNAATDLLPKFDRAVVAERTIALATGELDCIRATETPQRQEDIWQKADDLLFNHFGILA